MAFRINTVSLLLFLDKQEGITDDNLEESAYRTAIITTHSVDFTAYEANLVADIMDRIVWWNSSDYNVSAHHPFS